MGGEGANLKEAGAIAGLGEGWAGGAQGCVAGGERHYVARVCGIAPATAVEEPVARPAAKVYYACLEKVQNRYKRIQKQKLPSGDITVTSPIFSFWNAIL